MIILVDSLPRLTRTDAVPTFSEDVRRKSLCVGPESVSLATTETWTPACPGLSSPGSNLRSEYS